MPGIGLSIEGVSATRDHPDAVGLLIVEEAHTDGYRERACWNSSPAGSDRQATGIVISRSGERSRVTSAWRTLRRHGLLGTVVFFTVFGAVLVSLGYPVPTYLAIAFTALYATVAKAGEELLDLGHGGFEVLYAVGVAVGLGAYFALAADAGPWILLITYSFCAWLVADGLQQRRRGPAYWRTEHDRGGNAIARFGRRVLAPVHVEVQSLLS